MIPLILLAEEEDQREEKMNQQRYRRCLRLNRSVIELPRNSFIQNFRVSHDIFAEILREIEGDLTPGTSIGITAEQKLAAALRFFATGHFQQGVGKDFHIPMAQSTFSTMLTKVLNSMERKLCSKYIMLDMSEADAEAANQYFNEKSGISGVVMCADGTHIRIKRPNTNEHFYYNRKGVFSINALMICDHQQRIRFVNAKYGGAKHDAHVWNRSPARSFFAAKHRNGNTAFKLLGTIFLIQLNPIQIYPTLSLRQEDVMFLTLINNKFCCLIGDSAYPREDWLLIPVRDANPSSADAQYNERHTAGRIIIERTFGVLKSRFRCLAGTRELQYAPSKCVKIINVCCALHNMCIEHGINS
ncbi:putative nuclease HARBI1 isoform X1 [Anopheles funestus]|uniref:putative nuclease HARBI1 isoform X1 n=1 Tax=Anopheles funestus TaxID=62324 RepID=UPI0020C662B4|nr:putative nuclease HARBI1 isoform X1 [Anopheles funestus]